MRYPHRIRLWRPGEGGEYLDGIWTPAAAAELYSGPADVQDSGRAVRRSSDNSPVVQSDAVVYLPRLVSDLRTGDLADIDWGDGSTAYARVVKSVRLDDSVHIEYVRQEGTP